MQIQITLDGSEGPETLAKIKAMLYALGGPMIEDRRFSARDKDELSALKEALTGDFDIGSETVEFGKQPLPAGVLPIEAIAGHFQVPLAPPAPPAAGAAPSPTAPEATTGSSAAPAAPPVPPAPPAAATPPRAPAGEVDKNGLPWDERIHSGSREKNKDGSWRYRRFTKLSDAQKNQLIAETEAELRGQAVAAPMTIRTIPATGGEPDAAPAPPLPPAAPELTFGMVAKRVTAKLTLGELTTAELTKRLAELGFPDGLHTINSRPDMWLTVLAALGA